MDKNIPFGLQDPIEEEERPAAAPDEARVPVRVNKTLMVNPVRAKFIDEKVVSFHYYNSFNYALLAEQQHNVHLTIGVTSPNRGEGKTLAASNLAVSLTMGYKRKTVLVDMNFHHPRLHKIFGAPPGPGLLDALEGGTVPVSPTVVENLYVLPAGTRGKGKPGIIGGMPIRGERTTAFGDVIPSLQEEYDFVSVDMPAINLRQFPILFVNHLDGVFVVIEAGKTRRVDLEKMFRHLNKDQVLGFVMNRVRDDKN